MEDRLGRSALVLAGAQLSKALGLRHTNPDFTGPGGRGVDSNPNQGATLRFLRQFHMQSPSIHSATREIRTEHGHVPDNLPDSEDIAGNQTKALRTKLRAREDKDPTNYPHRRKGRQME